MKNILLAIWCVLTAFVSPLYLALAFLHVTGRIYQYDFSIEAGIVEFLGIFGLVLWLLLVLCPDVYFLRRSKRKPLSFCILLLPALLCSALCGWDLVYFLTA